MSRSSKGLFKWRQYQGTLILLGVRWYLTFTVSCRQRQKMLYEQDRSGDHTAYFAGCSGMARS
jgi:transposase-like protein